LASWDLSRNDFQLGDLYGGLGDPTFGGAGNGHDPDAAWPGLGRPWQNEKAAN
jgi:hypothetical protein